MYCKTIDFLKYLSLYYRVVLVRNNYIYINRCSILIDPKEIANDTVLLCLKFKELIFKKKKLCQYPLNCQCFYKPFTIFFFF